MVMVMVTVLAVTVVMMVMVVIDNDGYVMVVIVATVVMVTLLILLSEVCEEAFLLLWKVTQFFSLNCSRVFFLISFKYTLILLFQKVYVHSPGMKLYSPLDQKYTFFSSYFSFP